MDCVSGDWKNGAGEYVSYIRTERKLVLDFSPFLDFRWFSCWKMNRVWQNVAHKSASLCYFLSGLTASWRNLTQLTCSCERLACRNGLELWAGVQTHRNYHQAWYSSVTESLWESCFVWWSRPPCGLLFCHHCWWYQIFHPGVFADLVR